MSITSLLQKHKDLSPQEELAARRLDEIRSARLSLYTFFKQAWPSLEGATPFVDGWHIGAIAEHLEAVFKRQIKRLLINVPPRSGKSSLVSAAFPAWVWLHKPSEKFLYASYAGSLSMEHSLKCRRLIESEWYVSRWGRQVQLTSDQNAKSFFDNTAGGYRIATSVGGSSTGKGGSILICDDPNNAKDGESEVKRDSTNKWKAQVWSTRLNDPKNDCEIVIQQRLQEQDVSGIILSDDRKEEWVKLILPNEFEEGRRTKTMILPSSQGKVWQDPRTQEGELLCPERFGKQETDRAKKELGSYGYAGQYQQRPSPEEGGIIKKAWFKWWKNEGSPDIEMIIQSWDMAYTTNKTSSYSVCTTWGYFNNEYGLGSLILLGMWRDKVGDEELRKRVKRLYFDYRDTGPVRNPALKGQTVGPCLVEVKANGRPILEDLHRAGIPAIGCDPGKYGKIERVRHITHLIEAGVIWLPAQSPHYTSLLPFAQDFERHMTLFPNAETRDVVDSMTQCLFYGKRELGLADPHDPRDPDKRSREVKRYF